MQENVQITPQGISITVQPEEKDPKVFFISNEQSEDGVHFASIIHTYKEALKNDDIPVYPNSPFLFTGKRKNTKLVSTFVNTPLGKRFIVIEECRF